MIKTYIRIELSSEGESPKQIIERMRQIDAVPVIGEYDFELSLGEDERLFDKLEDIHHVLRGSSVRYTVTTRTDVDKAAMNNGIREITHMVDQKPVELRKKLYRAKLERWREMGLDVDELEQLLDEDLDKFKVASRTFLKTHLDSISVVKDKHLPQNLIDGDILSLITEEGKTLPDLMALTGHSEEQITLSLGRLISAGSTILDSTGKTEIYRLVPPPAPPMRKPLKVLDAAGEEDAEERIMNALRPNGSTKVQLARASRLPPEQATKALASLSKKGRIRVVRKGNRALFYPA
ncbi:MAG: hypothetical protein IH630_08850 [Thermoplasmata archaeon]|nr:hypothetical protein [Thermoplasmata archaeon]MCJ7562700.1 hypothetical protein [Thermoplasmata archaeon]TFG70234.1 MAG: hypothetical protein E4H25_02750 [Methanomassiliicoccus sp.]